MAGVKSINKADGGYISGGRHQHKRQHSAWLSNGEYVLRAMALSAVSVSQPLTVLTAGMRTVVLSAHDNSFGSTGAGLSIGQVTVVAQDMNSFERVCGRNSDAVLGGEGK